MLIKRAFDIAAALAGLLLLAPVMAALALWIRWDSPGPALFRQQRVGRNGVLFTIYKFRTMRASAGDGGQLSLADDARATRAGRFLRRHKLDELPQLINVLRGDMSVVGPRPEVPRYVAHYPAPLRDIVLSVRPGITDWAAIEFRNEGEILRRAADPEQAYLRTVLPVKLDYYLRYVQHRQQRGLLTDLHIIWCTMRALLFGAASPGLAAAPAMAPAVPTVAAPVVATAGGAAGGPGCAPSARSRPRVRLLADSRLAPHDWQSLLISLVRGMAALQVAAAHLRAQVLPGLSTLEHPPLWYAGLSLVTGFAHQAVVLFFVLSGWLVGGALLDRLGEPHALRDFAIDRVTRLWIVLAPAFMMMLLLGLGSGELDADAPRLSVSDINPWSLTTLLGNLAGVQTMLVPPFGGNFPLWSLAYETWYYALFPLLALGLSTNPGHAQVRLAAASAAVVLVLCLSSGIVLYFTIWLMGAGASRIRIDLGRVQRMLCWLLFGVVALALRLHGQDGGMDAHALWRDAPYSALFLLCLCGAGRRNPASMRPLVALATFFASFSFTLYVMHVPLLQMLSAYRSGEPLSVDDTASMVVYAAMLAIVVSLSYLLHLPFEAQTHKLRRFIKHHLPGAARGKPGTPVPVPVPGEAG